jgi:hypothetical protein
MAGFAGCCELGVVVSLRELRNVDSLGGVRQLVACDV